MSLSLPPVSHRHLINGVVAGFFFNYLNSIIRAQKCFYTTSRLIIII